MSDANAMALVRSLMESQEQDRRFGTSLPQAERAMRLTIIRRMQFRMWLAQNVIEQNRRDIPGAFHEENGRLVYLPPERI